MRLHSRNSVYSTIGIILWLLAGLSNAWAQTSPNSASAIRQIEQDNKIKIVGSLCTTTATSGANTGASSGSTVSANANCGNDPVNFFDVDNQAVNSKTNWVIDGGTAQIGTVASASFTSPGVKTITITRTYSTTVGGVVSTSVVPSSFTISVGTPPSPFQKWFSDTTICKGTTIKLDPYPNGAPAGVTYLWFPNGKTTQAISETASGCYSVEATNEAGCSVQDRVQVRLCPEQSGSPGSKWYFGDNAGLDFGGGSPTPLNDGKLKTIEGSASITDTKGNVLFYSDGITVYDKDGKPMNLYDPVSGSLTSASAVLGGSQKSTQSAIIVPKPVCHGCDYLYYVYTTAEINGTRQITYSVVDMRRNDGKGAVVQQNIPVVTNTISASSTERSASVRRDRDTTYWVMTHDYGTNCFRVDQLTAQNSVSQKQFCLGTAHDTPARGEGQIKIGPLPTPVNTTVTSGSSTTGTSGTVVSGTITAGTPTSVSSNTAIRPVAVVIPGDPKSTDPDKRKSYVEIFNFNVETGELKGPDKRIDLGPAPPTAYGVEFSPDGTKVYVTLLGEVSSISGVQTQTGLSRILQFDITADDPVSTSAIIEESSTRQYGSLQLGPDGKIYVAVLDRPALSVIDNPNGSAGFTTNPFAKPPVFTVDGQDLGGKISQLGLPNQVANFSQPSNSAGLSVSSVCQGNPVQATITPYCPKLKESYTLTIKNIKTGAIVAQTASFTQTSQQYNISQPGTYSAILNVVVYASPGVTCTTATAETSFTIIEQPPKIDLGPDIEVCQSYPVSLTINVEAEQYAWARGRQIVSFSRVLSTTIAGTYTAFAANGGECFETDQIQILFRTPGPLDLGPPVPLCDKSTRVLAPASTQYTSYTWTSSVLSTSAVQKNLTVDKPGTYSVVASYELPNGAGPPIVCRTKDDIQVVGAKNPTVSELITNPLGCTTIDGAITLTPSPTSVVSGTGTGATSTTFTYSWTTVTGTPISTSGNSASALAEGSYRVSVTDANSCSVTNSYTLQSTTPKLLLTTQATPQQCDNPSSGSVTLGVSGGVPVLYEWRDKAGNIISTTPSLTGVSAGVYSVSVASSIGCVSSLSAVPVGLNTAATLSLSDRSKCVGDTIEFRPSRLGNFTSGVIYRWSTGETSERISPKIAGTYSLTATNVLNGCVGTASAVAKFVDKPSVSAGTNLSLCLGAPGSLTSLQLSGSSPGGGTWSGPNVDVAGRFTPTASQIGQVITLTYSVTANGCANSAPKQVALKPTPVITPLTDLTFCEGTNRTVQALGSPGAVFRWSDGTQGSLLRPTQTGRYVVIVDLAGCEQTDDVQVTVDPAPRFGLTREAIICVGDRQQTELRVVPQSPGQIIRWTTGGESTTAITVSSVGTYSVVVTGTNGCVARDAARVVDLCEPRLQAPNAFSPNGDGNNDKFGPLYAYTTDLEVRIYNRWGEVIFASTPDKPDWDGTYRGEPAQTMLYPYVISYRSQYFPDRPAVVKRGSVLLLR